MSYHQRLAKLERAASRLPEVSRLDAEIAAALALPSEGERDAELLRLRAIATGPDLKRVFEALSHEAFERLYREEVESFLDGCEAESSEGDQ